MRIGNTVKMYTTSEACAILDCTRGELQNAIWAIRRRLDTIMPGRGKTVDDRYLDLIRDALRRK